MARGASCCQFRCVPPQATHSQLLRSGLVPARAFRFSLDSGNHAGVSSQVRDYEKISAMQEKCEKFLSGRWVRSDRRTSQDLRLHGGFMFGAEHCQPFSTIQRWLWLTWLTFSHCWDRQEELSCRPVLESTMKLPFLVITLTLAALLAAQPSQAQNAFTPDQVKYGPAPPFLPVGAQLAALEGDPMAISPFASRCRTVTRSRPTHIPAGRT